MNWKISFPRTVSISANVEEDVEKVHLKRCKMTRHAASLKLPAWVAIFTSRN